MTTKNLSERSTCNTKWNTCERQRDNKRQKIEIKGEKAVIRVFAEILTTTNGPRDCRKPGGAGPRECSLLLGVRGGLCFNPTRLCMLRRRREVRDIGLTVDGVEG